MEQKFKEVRQTTYISLPLEIVEHLESLGFTVFDMYLVPKGALSNPLDVETFRAPSQINIICPHCKKPVELHSEHKDWKSCGDYNLYKLERKCYLRECKKPIYFILLNPNGWQEDYGNSSALWMYPQLEERLPLKDVNNVLTIENFSYHPEELKDAYHSAINMLTTNHWRESARSTTDLFEGLINNILGKGKEMRLAQQVEAFPEHIDLAKSIFLLADALGEGRNLSNHFKYRKNITEEIAIDMLDLVEELVKYLYVLPKRIESLIEKIDSRRTEENPKPLTKKKELVSIMLPLQFFEKLKKLSEDRGTSKSDVISSLLDNDTAVQRYKKLPETLKIELNQAQLETLRTIFEILDFTKAESITNLLDRITID